MCNWRPTWPSLYIDTPVLVMWGSGTYRTFSENRSFRSNALIVPTELFIKHIGLNNPGHLSPARGQTATAQSLWPRTIILSCQLFIMSKICILMSSLTTQYYQQMTNDIRGVDASSVLSKLNIINKWQWHPRFSCLFCLSSVFDSSLQICTKPDLYHSSGLVLL